MGKIIAVANQKGGVGKTTTSLNLAASFAVAEQRTLIVDVDPQANGTSGIGIDSKKLEHTIYDVFTDACTIKEIVQHTSVPFLDVAPSHINLVGSEIEMVDLNKREHVLSKALAKIRDDYAYIIIDCPPSLGLLTLNALTAADTVLIPVQCEYFALEGLGQLLNTVTMVKKNLNPELEIEGVLLTMYDSRLRLSNQVVSEVKKYFGDKVFRTLVVRNVRLSEAPSFGKPVIMYDALSIGARNYIELAHEILTRDGVLAVEPRKA